MGGLSRGTGATEDKPGECAEAKRQNLPECTRDEHHADDAGKRNAGTLTIRREAFRHAPHGLRHHGDSDDLQTVQQTGADRPFDRGGDHGEKNEENGRWQSECRPGRQRTERPCPEQPQRKPHLAGGRARQKLAERHEIGITSLVDPFAPHDKLVAEITEMGDGAAEGGDAKLQKGCENLPRCALRRSITFTFLRCHISLHTVPRRLVGTGWISDTIATGT